MMPLIFVCMRFLRSIMLCLRVIMLFLGVIMLFLRAIMLRSVFVRLTFI